MDVEQFRAETPMRPGLIHLDNAGSSLQPAAVLAAVQQHIDLEAAIGGYRAIEQNAAVFDDAYAALAEMLNCASSEIALIENATRAWDMAFYSLLESFTEGQTILTAEAEYASNYMAYLQAAKRKGVEVITVPSDGDGCVDVDALASRIDARTCLIAITHLPTNGGLVNPAAEIGRVAKAHGVPFLLDACQSVGQIDLDVEAIGCDFLSGTGRKYLRGPRGTGFLYIRKAWVEKLEPVFIDLFAAQWTGPESYTLRPDAKRFENFEKAFAQCIGLGAAVRYGLDIGFNAIEARVQDLARKLRDGLRAVSGVHVHDLGRAKSGICTFTIDGMDAAAVREALWTRQINTSVSAPRSTLLDARARDLTDMNRASVHYFNTEDEIAQCVSAVAEIAARQG